MPNTTNFNFPTPADTDLVKDGALAIRNLGNSIDTAFVDLKGGTTGQVLSKNSNTDLDYTWVAQDDSNAIQNAIIDAKGDLIVGTAADTPARLAVGATNGHVLTVDSSEATGVKWAAAGSSFPATAASANVSAVEFTTSTSYTDLTTASAVTLTTGTKALVIVSTFIRTNESAQQAFASFAVSGATSIAASDENAVSQVDQDANYISASRATLVTLTAGSNTFTMKFRASGGTARCQTYNRSIFVMNLA